VRLLGSGRGESRSREGGDGLSDGKGDGKGGSVDGGRGGGLDDEIELESESAGGLGGDGFLSMDDRSVGGRVHDLDDGKRTEEGGGGSGESVGGGGGGRGEGGVRGRG